MSARAALIQQLPGFLYAADVKPRTGITRSSCFEAGVF